jgi:SAM-dependent methyltransferase
LERDATPVRLIDLGSGQGDLLAEASQRWPRASLVGIEPSEVGVRESQRKVPSARFITGDITAGTEIPDDLHGWATHVVCSEVLEHLDDPAGLLRAALPMLATGGLIVVTVPGGRISAFDKEIGHRRHYTPESLAQLVRAAGYGVDWTSGAGFPFFNLYRAVVIARGDRLAHDVAADEGGAPSLAARVAMASFRPLFRLTLTRSRWGTQIVGVGRRP